jgi:hypothetical protein
VNRLVRSLLAFLALVLSFRAFAGEDGVLYSTTFRNGVMGPVKEERLAPSSAAARASVLPAAVQASKRSSAEKINPHLSSQIKAAAPGARTRVIVLFEDPEVMRPFPRIDHTVARTHPKNVAAEADVQRRIDDLTMTRKRGHQPRLAALQALGARVEEMFWLVNGVVLEVPLAAIPRLAEREDVADIAEVNGGAPLPVYAGRTLINSFFLESRVAQPQTGNPWLFGLLDSGVRSSHTLFTPRSLLLGEYDCVNGTSNNCRTGTGLNPSDNCSHGTATASVLIGNNSLGSDFLGVTRFALRSYKVYPPCNVNGDTQLDSAAAVRGFQAAMADVSDVIVAEIQDYDPAATGAVATAADYAYDCGYIVVAPTGNFGVSETTSRSPAGAHKVIGVGAIYQGAPAFYQNHGTLDGRIKPDIEAPTSVTSASSVSVTATMLYNGTSGSLPYAAAAGALLGYWRDPYGAPPGYVYTRLINWGSNFTDAATNNIEGAGLIVLPSANGTAWWGHNWVGQNQSVWTSITVPANSYDLRVALWWPESASQPHNNIDLFIYKPSGPLVALSQGTTSVFEKAYVPGPLETGTYLVRIEGSVIQTPGVQRVYLDLYARN